MSGLTEEQVALLRRLAKKKYLRPDEKGELDHLRFSTSDPELHERIDRLRNLPDDPQFVSKGKGSPWIRQ